MAVRFYLADAFRSVVIRISCWLSVLRALGALSLVFLSPRAVFASPLPQRLVPLQEELKRQGFAIVFMHPANKSAYGTYDAKKKRLTISPLAFELGIGEQVFVHEAVHAAQSCPSGTLSPLGWSFPVPRVVQNEISGVLYNAYRHKNKALEREAFMAQSRPDAVPLLISALKSRCR